MKIVSLKAQNVKRLRAVEIRPEAGGMVVIGGRNAQGKSSVLDSIAYALGGKDLICADPIRHGEDRAVIECDVGDYFIKRVFTPSGSTVTVSGKQGETFKSPQALLDKLTGTLTFDPLAFSRAAPKAQMETLRKLAGLDFTLLDNQRAATFAKRTDVNRERDRLTAAANSMTGYTIAAKEEVSVAALVAERDKAAAEAARITTVEQKIAAIQDEVERMRAAAVKMLAEAKQLAESIEGAVMPDVASYYTKIAGTEAENAKVRANAALEKARAAAKDRADESNKLTAELAALDQKKAEMIRGATMPVEGLSLTEDGVVYRGVPFAQASSAEQLRVSVAMGIAMNPTLKVLLIHDGSLLDDESLADVASMAAAADAQVWIERVGHGEECSVVIEDGSVEAEGGAE